MDRRCKTLYELSWNQLGFRKYSLLSVSTHWRLHLPTLVCSFFWTLWLVEANVTMMISRCLEVSAEFSDPPVMGAACKLCHAGGSSKAAASGFFWCLSLYQPCVALSGQEIPRHGQAWAAGRAMHCSSPLAEPAAPHWAVWERAWPQHANLGHGSELYLRAHERSMQELSGGT